MKTIVNNTERDVPFSLEEYNNRLKKAKDIMKENDIELIFLTSPESLYYFSGYKLAWYRINSLKQWDYYVPASIAIHVDYDDFIFFDVAGEEADVREDTVAKDIRIFTHAGRPTYGISGNAGVIPHGGKLIDSIVENLKESGWLTNKIGIESEKHGCHVSEMLTDSFSKFNCETFNATEIIDSIRQVKSKAELDYIVKAAHIIDVGMEAAKEYLKPGVTENELYAYMNYKMACAGGEREGVSFIHGGARASRGHNFPSHKKLSKGDVVVVDVFGSHQRYSADLSRVFTIGEPELNKYENVNLDFYKIAEKFHPIIREKVTSILKPNMLVNDFTNELKGFYKELGIWGKQFWLGGYDMGILWPGDCSGGTTVYDADIDKKGMRFVPGTAVNFETGFWVIETLAFYEDKAIIAGQTPWDIIKV